MYVTDRAHIAPVAEAHGEVFGEVRPASTAIVVAGLIDPSLLVEIEADAHAALGRQGHDLEVPEHGHQPRGQDEADQQAPARRDDGDAQANGDPLRPDLERRRTRVASRVTIVFTAASAASTAGPTRRRYSRTLSGRRSNPGMRSGIARNG